MIRIDALAPGRVRVIGRIEAAALDLLTEALAHGVVALDLSGVEQADENAVRLLAALPPERVTLEHCPTWLEMWIERERRGPG